MKLTQKESQLLTYIREGMDKPGCGWLHELQPANWSNRSTAGVLSSLIRKNLVTSIKHVDHEVICYWVEVI